MMRRTSGAILCLVAIGATFALTSGTALATENLPSYGKCTKLATLTGKYSNGGCTKLAVKEEQKKYEWEPLTTTVKFTSKKEKLTGKAVLESVSGSEISCIEQSAKEGEFGPGNQQKNIVTEFSGCEALGASCQSEGQTAGKIITKKLHGEPGIVKKELKEEKNIDGHDLQPQVGEDLAEFSCATAPVLVRGGIVIKDQADSTGGTTGETTNKMLNLREVEFVGEKPGKQVPEEWTPNGGGISHTEHKLTTEHLEGNTGGKGFEGSSQSFITVETTNPKTVKVELRQCEKTIVC